MRFDKLMADRLTKTRIPRFLEIGADVSDEKKYYSFSVADE